MKKYMNPYLEIYKMEEADVIRTSGLVNGGAGGDVDETPDGESWGNLFPSNV